MWILSLALACKPTVEAGGTTDDDPQPVAIAELQASPLESMGSILQATWTQVGAGSTWLEFSFDQGEWWSSPPVERPAGAAEELVLGAPFDSPVQLRVAWEGGSSEAIEVSTAPLPQGAPVPWQVEGDPTAWDPAMPWVLTCFYGASSGVDGAWSVIVDRQGRAVWALEGRRSRVHLQTQPSAAGDSILIDQNSFWSIYDNGASAQVDEVSITGELLQTWDTPGMHHPFTQTDDGTIAYGQIQGYFVDESLALLHPDGTLETTWSCQDFIVDEDGQLGSYCGSNTLSWQPERGSFLYSFFSLETVIEVDAETGETLRYFGHDGRDAWGFDPADSAFWWQHGVHYTDHGTLLVSSKDEQDGSETVFREYELDEEGQVLVQVRSFGEGEGVYGDTMGEADYTPGGHVLHNYGDTPRLREVDDQGQVVWDATWAAQLIGRSTPLSDLYAFGY